MSRPVVHKSWVKRNAFGGITTTTQCRRSTTRGGDGMNVADTDEQVTCKRCRWMIVEGICRASFEASDAG